MKVSWPLTMRMPCVVKCKKKQLTMRIRAESMTRRFPPRRLESKSTSRKVISSYCIPLLWSNSTPVPGATYDCDTFCEFGDHSSIKCLSPGNELDARRVPPCTLIMSSISIQQFKCFTISPLHDYLSARNLNPHYY